MTIHEQNPNTDLTIFVRRAEIKKDKDFSIKREEILEMIWDMEEEIMGKDI